MRKLRYLDELTTEFDVSERFVDVIYNGAPEEYEDIADYIDIKEVAVL